MSSRDCRGRPNGRQARPPSGGRDRVRLDLDEHGGVDQSGDLDHRRGRVVAVEELGVGPARKTAERFGTVDILINNAAIFETVPMSRVGFMELEEEEWDRLLAVNLKGPWLCARAVFPHMKERGSGKIINIASGTVFGGGGSRPHYVASKAGIIGLTRNLAREIGKFGINVNTLAPGSTLTDDLPEGADVEMRERAAQGRALKRVETPEDLVGAAIFLSSSDSDFITGQLVNVDGGSTMY